MISSGISDIIFIIFIIICGSEKTEQTGPKAANTEVLKCQEQRFLYVYKSLCEHITTVETLTVVNCCIFSLDSTDVQEVFVRLFNESVSLWYTFGGGTKLIVDLGVVPPSLTVLLPSSEEQEQGNVALVCLANRGFPGGWKLGWRLGAGGPLQGSQSLEVLEKDSHYSWSSSLTLPTDQWRKAGSVTCEASLKDQTPVTHTLEPHHCSQ
ncbi:immunoglobulin lambda-like polypeptide 5 [Oncorhynchus clarkii lewisi]|uniref:immunoglobulin lambda-like polypeptide 5 n=1 Tax=Oncorhynchus clarkii lewisi TaxID=490388 RepID=UPI0039B92012